MTDQPQHPRELTVRWTDLLDLISEGNMCSRQGIIDRIKDYNEIYQCQLITRSRPAPAAPEFHKQEQICMEYKLERAALVAGGQKLFATRVISKIENSRMNQRPHTPKEWDDV